MIKTRILGILRLLLLYYFIVVLAVLYLEPLFYMISMSFKSFSDIVDPTTKWIPKDATLENIRFAYQQMNVNPMFISGKTLWNNLLSSTLFVSVITTLPAAMIQVFTCALAGYAFGRLQVPCKGLLLVLLIITYIVPPQTVFIPLTWVYKNFGLLNNPLSFIVPALFGHGLKGGLFVVIYLQFFRKVPLALEEAAMMDGANPLTVFLKIIFPLARPAMVTVFLFSMVWHWNETFLTSTFYTRIFTLSVQITKVTVALHEYDLTILPAKMASALIFILPLLVIYLFTQRFFTESIERTGIVE